MGPFIGGSRIWEREKKVRFGREFTQQEDWTVNLG